ncbi:hypothetical protein D7Y25_17595 [Parabacteroides goldsteinii]|nr:hypothetical protein D7Y25_17595 [Parabacteroides goldsteinii]
MFRLSACKDAGFYVTEQIKKDIIKHIFKIIETYLQLLLFFNNWTSPFNYRFVTKTDTVLLDS